MRRNSVKTTAFSGQPHAFATVKQRSSPRTSASPFAFTWMVRASFAHARSSEASSFMRRSASCPFGRDEAPSSSNSSSTSSANPSISSTRSACAVHSTPAIFWSSVSASLSSVAASANEDDARIFR